MAAAGSTNCPKCAASTGRKRKSDAANKDSSAPDRQKRKSTDTSTGDKLVLEPISPEKGAPEEPYFDTLLAMNLARTYRRLLLAVRTPGWEGSDPQELAIDELANFPYTAFLQHNRVSLSAPLVRTMAKVAVMQSRLADAKRSRLRARKDVRQTAAQLLTDLTDNKSDGVSLATDGLTTAAAAVTSMWDAPSVSAYSLLAGPETRTQLETEPALSTDDTASAAFETTLMLGNILEADVAPASGPGIDALYKQPRKIALEGLPFTIKDPHKDVRGRGPNLTGIPYWDACSLARDGATRADESRLAVTASSKAVTSLVTSSIPYWVASAR